MVRKLQKSIFISIFQCLHNYEFLYLHILHIFGQKYEFFTTFHLNGRVFKNQEMLRVRKNRKKIRNVTGP